MDINNLLTRSFGNMFTGLGKTILGDFMGRYNFNHDWTPLNVRTVWVDTSYNELLSVAQNVPHLNVIIHRSAKMFSLMNLRHVDKDGNDIENSEVIAFMRRPSPLQHFREWLYTYYVYDSIYNNVFLFPVRGLPSSMPAALNILPSGLMKANLTGKVYRQYKKEQIIDSWNMLGDTQDFLPSEIIHMTEGLTMNGVIGASPITSLQIPLSNIMGRGKSENIIINERGMIGFIQTDSKDDAGPMPINAKMKKVVQDTYQNKYSLDSRSSHVGIFSGNTKWVPMTFDIQQLGLREGNEEDFCTILGQYGIPREMFPSAKGATYENQNQAQKGFITNTLQPAANRLVETLAYEVFKLQNGEKLIGDYSYLPIMQEDKIKEGQAYMARVQANSVLYHDGIISPEDYANDCDRDMSGPGEPILASQPTKQDVAAQNAADNPEDPFDENNEMKMDLLFLEIKGGPGSGEYDHQSRGGELRKIGEFTVERETPKAYLISKDGKKVWIQKRWINENTGKLTPAGQKNFDAAKTVEQQKQEFEEAHTVNGEKFKTWKPSEDYGRLYFDDNSHISASTTEQTPHGYYESHRYAKGERGNTIFVKASGGKAAKQLPYIQRQHLQHIAPVNNGIGGNAKIMVQHEDGKWHEMP